VEIRVKVASMVDAEISNYELARVVFRKALDIGGLVGLEDYGYSWFTDDAGNTYIRDVGRKVSDNPQVAALIDAYHAILGYPFDTFKLPIVAEQAPAEAA
jgi:hypothetical protein